MILRLLRQFVNILKTVGEIWAALSGVCMMLAVILPVVLTRDWILRSFLFFWSAVGAIVGFFWTYGYWQVRTSRQVGSVAALWRIIVIVVAGVSFYLLLDILYKATADLPPILQRVKLFMLDYQRVANFVISVPMAVITGTLASGFVAFSNLGRFSPAPTPNPCIDDLGAR